MRMTAIMLAAVCAVPCVVLAQPKPVTQTEGVEMTALIDAIDYTARLVTLRTKDGETETIHVGPEVKRLAELKAGQTVTFRYYESTAYVIRKPGQTAPAPGTGDPKMERGKGAKPSGTIAQQETATVTITAIDAKVPSVTVLTEDGRKVSFKVDDKKNIEGLKVGDKVDVTYTEAVMISVK
jgi:hypothetical protein